MVIILFIVLVSHWAAAVGFGYQSRVLGHPQEGIQPLNKRAPRLSLSRGQPCSQSPSGPQCAWIWVRTHWVKNVAAETKRFGSQVGRYCLGVLYACWTAFHLDLSVPKHATVGLRVRSSPPSNFRVELNASFCHCPLVTCLPTKLRSMLNPLLYCFQNHAPHSINCQLAISQLKRVRGGLGCPQPSVILLK